MAAVIPAAAAVNLGLLGGLLLLNGRPPAVAAGEKPARLHAVRLGPLPSLPPRREPVAMLPATEPDRLGGLTGRVVPTLVEEPAALAVRGLDFSLAPGVSDLGVVPRGILPAPAAPPLDTADRGPTGAGAPGEGGAVTVGAADLDRAPQERSTPRPAYPRAALRAGREGFVETRLLLSERGDVEEVVIVRWEGHSAFAEAVRSGCRLWKFTPAVRGGRPIRVWKPYVVRFKLEG